MTTYQDHFAMMARYTMWANTRLYDACATLSDAARKQDRQVYFTSIHQTLNHILVGDRIWASRFYGTPWTDYRLDAELYADFNALRAAQMAETEKLLNWLESYDDPDFGGTFAYQTAAGGQYETRLILGLTHAFNHGTHHRGQVHAMITQAGGEGPDLDLIFYNRDNLSV